MPGCVPRVLEAVPAPGAEAVAGPVRAVVKLSGRFVVDKGRDRGNGGRRLLPWTMRVYLGAGAESLRLVHGFIWDGDVRRDFVRGLGLEVA